MGHAPWFALLASLLLACAGPAGPDPQAIARYAERKAAEPAPTDSPLQRDTPRSRVRIVVVEARDLPDTDTGPGDVDPYVILELDGQRVETSVAADDDVHVWGDSFIFETRPAAALVLTLMDSDTGIDEKLAVISLLLPPIAPGATVPLEIPVPHGEGATLVLSLEGLEPQL